MQKAEVFSRLQNVFRDQFNDLHLQIADDTSSGDIPDWDSLAHVRLLIAIEREFGCKFDTDELDALKSVGDLILCILAKKLN